MKGDADKPCRIAVPNSISEDLNALYDSMQSEGFKVAIQKLFEADDSELNKVILSDDDSALTFRQPSA